ncbi:hypothetical protein NZK35_34090, partial [Stieleria sp. ICT_E10.1]|uniref:hypothetical protein n=1 Tax=Stieleria sedimenti TaxID=2976331 RepID=UPI00218095F8
MPIITHSVTCTARPSTRRQPVARDPCFQGSALERSNAGVALPHAVRGREAGACEAMCPQAEPYAVN